jgi:DNA-binding transcriptional ArsR family regulator
VKRSVQSSITTVSLASTHADAGESDQVFASAADLFRLLATPMRLKIISALCGHEKNVTQLLAEIRTTQPNMSQHLAALHRAGVVARRREATQVYYRIGSERAAGICRAVCMQIAMEMEGDEAVPQGDRLTPAVR